MSDEDRRQQLGFVFESCKHLTTLNTASALVVLALNREIGLYLWPLMFFGLSLPASAWGMISIATRHIRAREGLWTTPEIWLWTGAFTFLGGLYFSFSGAYFDA